MSQRVVLVTHYYPAHGGGIERVALALAERLASTGERAIIWMASNSDAVPERLPVGMRCLPAQAWNGIERLLGAPFPLWSLGALRDLWQQIGIARLVHVHDALYMGNVAAVVFARMRGVPVIVTQHIGDVPFRSRWMRNVHALANRTLGRLVLGCAAQVIFISPAVRDEFAAYCRFHTMPMVVPNGVDTEIFNANGPVSNDPVIACARRAGAKVLLFVGRFVEKKGLAILHALAISLPDYVWVFAGAGPLDPAHWRLPNVHVVRGRSGVSLAAYYRAADLLVLPSIGEGFPLVVQEAMACGTPAMVGEQTVAGAPEAATLLVVEDVCVGDAVSRWRERLIKVLSVPDGLTARRSQVAEFAKAHWSWHECARHYDRVFNALEAPTRDAAP